MNARATELLNLELDDRLDAAGQAELETLLKDPDIAARRDSLRAVARALANAPQPLVPEGFADAVIAKARWRKPRHPLAGWRGGLALAASALIAVVVLRVADHDVARDDLSATLAPATPSINAERQADGALVLNLALPAGGSQLVIDFGPGDGALAASADVPLRVEGRRIVLPVVGAGRTAVRVTGITGEFTAHLIQDGHVKSVTVHSQ